jgi:hypothetical protein
MNFVAATTTGLFIHENGKLKKLLDGNFFGITWDDQDNIYACENIPTKHGTQIHVLNKDFDLRQKHRFPNIVHVHQALYDTYTGLIFVCNTFRDSVDLIHPVTFNIEHSILLSNKRADTVHVNSVFCTADKIFVCCHNRWTKTKNPSEIRIFDRDFNLIESFKAGQGCHNIYTKKNHIYLCSSEESTLLLYDLSKKKIVGSYVVPGDLYLRGMCRTAEGFLLGSSARRIRAERLNKTAGHVSFYSLSMKQVWEKTLPNVGQISDIRIIDEIDFCHNQIVLKRGSNDIQ